MKIEAEGVEMNILKKADFILSSKHTPDLIIEVEEAYLLNMNSSEKEIIKYLGSFGYKPYKFSPQGLVPLRSSVKRSILNLFFAKKRKIQPLINEKN